MANIAFDLPAPPSDGSGAPVDTTAMGALKTVTVSGAFSGVVVVEVSNDGGATFCELTSFTGPGDKTVAVAAQFMRVTRRNVDAANPGLPNVDVAAEPGLLATGTPAVPAGDGVGAALDVSSLGGFNTVCVTGAFGGLLTIEISEDGVDWQEVMSFSGPGLKSKEFVALFVRVRRSSVPAGSGTPVVALAATDSATGGGTAVSQPRTSVVYRPGDPAGSRQNVYVTWSEVMAALAAIEGPKALAFDDQFASPAVIPAGTHDMTDVEWVAPDIDSPSSRVAVQVGAGAVITNLRRISDLNVELDGSSGPNITISGIDVMWLRYAKLTSVNAPGVKILAGGILLFTLTDGAALGEFPTIPTPVPLGDIDAGAQAFVQSLSGGTAGQNIWVGAGDALYSSFSSSTLFSATQTGLTGSVLYAPLTNVSQSVVPAVTGARTAAHNEHVRLDPTAGPFAQTLPPSSITTAGQRVTFKNVTASANVVTINPSGTDTINGDNLINAGQKSLTFVDGGDGTWDSIG